MVIVNSSIWIDYFNDKSTPQTNHLDLMLGEQLIGMGDIILAEVLQGFREDKTFTQAKELMLSLDIFPMLGVENALNSANNYRLLRKQGITIRKTTDTMIASFCITHNHSLLFSDRDFLPFVEHLGLKPVLLS